ncbi:uncharacterized protein [Typha angustifolia]|uniref:uncharacterized protein n=1 Tax=Typha angustifolia TaxID=59011 RepID=UPI003C303DAF
MACLSASPSARGRRLSELLEEQQEPFFLDVYLLENGYSTRMLEAQAANMCWPGNASRRLQRLTSNGFKRTKGGLLRCVLSKILHRKHVRKALNWNSMAPEIGSPCLAECFSKTGSKTRDQLSCCRGICTDELDAGHEWNCLEEEEEEEEDPKQLSPVSVLELHCYESSPVHIQNKEEKSSRTLSLDSPKKVIDIFKELLEAAYTPAFNQFSKSDELEQPQQLVLDCVREVEGRNWDQHQCSSPTKTEKFFCEEAPSWESQEADEAWISQLIASDLSNSSKEWIQFKPQIREIGTKIEASIFEQLREEAVLDIIDLNCTAKRC